jgi:hypothetical protein
MTKEFVSYDIALKLKKLGFDEPCLARWIEKDSRDGGGLKLEIWNDEDTVFEVKSWTKAPTWQSAFRWFREQGFISEVTSLSNDEYEFYIKWSFAYSFLSDIYKTYEEAELACLDKLIEIVRRKQHEKN